MIHELRPVDRDLQTLSSAKGAWAQLPLELKIAMLRTVKRNVSRVAREWANAASAAKGIEGSPLAGEEWISGPWAVLYALERYIRTLQAVTRTGNAPVRARTNKDGQTVVDVFPNDLYDRLLLTGVRAEVRMRAGVTPAQTVERAASFYHHPHDGRVCVVLGAGNISSIAPLDVLYKLVGEGCVCMVKMNPVNAYLQPVFERAFEPFVQAGFVRFAGGGAEMGAYLCSHPAVDYVHVTGSEETHRAIVREARGKTITSELGNVSPTIVVPGAWSDRDLRYQAEHIVTQKMHNAGFNCIAAQVLLVPKDWNLTPKLKAHVANVLREADRPEYYPGARERRESLVGQSPSRVIVDVSPDDDEFFLHEAFCGVLACLELPGDIPEFLRAATSFANERLRGTLGANIIADPRTMRAHRDAIAGAVDDLHYGCVGVNAWTGVGYFINETPWGAFPGHTLSDPGSGIGVVHNSMLLEDTEKSVVYAPFRSFPKPPWFVTNRNAARIGEALCAFEMNRSPRAAMRVAKEALRG